MKLRDLDDALVPRLAERVARTADRLAVRRERLRAAGRPDAATLRDLDQRLTSRGPLALVREVPQLGFVVIAAVLLAGVATARSQEAERTRAQQREQSAVQTVDPATGEEGEDGVAVTALGPEVGTTVTAYTTAAALNLRQAALKGGDEQRVALVTFGAYRTPLQVRELLQGYPVVRAYLHAAAAGKNAVQLPVEVKGDVLASLTEAYRTTVQQRTRAQREFQGYVDTITVTTKEEQVFKDYYVAYARASGIEAREYQSGCACVFSALVTGTPGQLLQLRSRSGVRAVEVAGPGLTAADLQVRPLLPGTTGVVPKAQADPSTQP